MAVAEDDDVARPKARSGSSCRLDRRPSLVSMDEEDCPAIDRDGDFARQEVARDVVVIVPMNGNDGRDETELIEDRQAAEIAGVEDEIGAAQRRWEVLRKGLIAKMGIGDDRNPQRLRRLTDGRRVWATVFPVRRFWLVALTQGPRLRTSIPP
jgi:hypothetical protein